MIINMEHHVMINGGTAGARKLQGICEDGARNCKDCVVLTD